MRPHLRRSNTMNGQGNYPIDCIAKPDGNLVRVSSLRVQRVGRRARLRRRDGKESSSHPPAQNGNGGGVAWPVTEKVPSTPAKPGAAMNAHRGPRFLHAGLSHVLVMPPSKTARKSERIFLKSAETSAKPPQWRPRRHMQRRWGRVSTQTPPRLDGQCHQLTHY